MPPGLLGELQTLIKSFGRTWPQAVFADCPVSTCPKPALPKHLLCPLAILVATQNLLSSGQICGKLGGGEEGRVLDEPSYVSTSQGEVNNCVKGLPW